MPRILPAIDARWVAQSLGFRRVTPTPEPVTNSWLMEGQAYGTVLRDGAGKWRMWYLDDPIYTEHFATSDDGLHWQRPNLNLGLVNIKHGATKPNAFMTSPSKDPAGNWLSGLQGPEGFCVLDRTITPHPAGTMRYTALYLARWAVSETRVDRGLCIVHSDDGITWHAGPGNPVIHGWADTGNIFFWDPKIGRYVIYGRPNACVNRVTHANRLVGRCESEDLIHWTPFQTVLDADDLDADPQDFIDEAAFRAGKNLTKEQLAAIWNQVTEGGAVLEKPMIRGRNRQWYGMTVFPWRDLYIGIGMMYDVPTGHIWLELLHSYDGVDWRREHGRKPWIGMSPEQWDRPLQVPSAGPPVLVGDDMWFYYSATAKSHHGITNEAKTNEAGQKQPLRAIGVRKLPRDRFVGYQCVNWESELLTHAMHRPGSLRLNVEFGPGGYLRAEACNRDGIALPGMALSNCIPVNSSGMSVPVSWNGGGSEGLMGSEVRFRLVGRNATVYGVEIQD